MESIFSTIINTLTDNIFSLNVFFLFSVKHIVRVEIIILLGITLKVKLTVVCKYSLRCKQFKEQYIREVSHFKITINTNLSANKKN